MLLQSVTLSQYCVLYFVLCAKKCSVRTLWPLTDEWFGGECHGQEKYGNTNHARSDELSKKKTMETGFWKAAPTLRLIFKLMIGQLPLILPMLMLLKLMWQGDGECWTLIWGAFHSLFSLDDDLYVAQSVIIYFISYLYLLMSMILPLICWKLDTVWDA